MLKNNFVIWFNIMIWILGLCLFSCFDDSTGPEDPLTPLVGSYTAFECTMDCLPESNYFEIDIVPPILTSVLNIQSNKSFTWTLTIIEDEDGIVPDCFGVTSASMTVSGSVSVDGSQLVFDITGEGIENYSFTLNGSILKMTSSDGKETFKFNKQ